MADPTVTSRIARELENRESTVRKQEWRPPQLLPTPNPQPNWEFKYIRISLMGQADPTNSSAMFREGWEPVKAADHPEIMHTADDKSRYKDNIEIGGLLLCKAPSETVQQRKDYYAKQAQAQMEAVDNNFMRQRDQRTNMELFADRKSTTTFGRGSK
jgi:hypothetical protein